MMEHGRGAYPSDVPQNRGEGGRFQPGVSGNPGGRAGGLARRTRELLGGDGEPVILFWLQVLHDDGAKMSERLEASKLLADRGWGKAPVVCSPETGATAEPEVTDEQRDIVVATFRKEVLRLSAAAE